MKNWENKMQKINDKNLMKDQMISIEAKKISKSIK